MAADHLRSVLPTMTTSPLGNGKTSLKNFHLVVLTGKVPFQLLELTIHGLRLFALQLDNGLAVKANLFVHVINGLVLIVEFDMEVLVAVVDDVELALQLVNPILECGDPIIQAIIGCYHAHLQVIITFLSGLKLVDKTIPHIILHLNGPIGMSGVDIKLSKHQGQLNLHTLQYSH